MGSFDSPALNELPCSKDTRLGLKMIEILGSVWFKYGTGRSLELKARFLRPYWENPSDVIAHAV